MFIYGLLVFTIASYGIVALSIKGWLGKAAVTCERSDEKLLKQKVGNHQNMY